ncbi:MAG: OmpH family outer membrane protein, partial [Flavobacteriales bacterium]
MKKLILISLICLTSIGVNAQKFAYVDSDYILERMPEYGSAQDQLDKLSLNWQEEIEELYQQIDQLYKKYQADKVLLTQEMKNKRESEIINKEKDAKEDDLKFKREAKIRIPCCVFIFHQICSNKNRNTCHE